jgi:glutaredoxin
MDSVDKMIMESIDNSQGVFTILTKTGCNNCKTLKKILELNNHTTLMVNCDEYLINDREGFIKAIREQIRNDIEKIYFPIVFYDGMYVENPYAFIKELF